MKRLKVILTIVMVLLMAGTLFAGGGKEVAASKGRIGLSMPTQSTERWVREGHMMRDKFEALGYQVDLQYAEDNVSTQLSQIENMLLRGLDALIISSIDGSSLTDAVKRAKEQGTYVVAYDRLLMNTPDVDYYVTFDSIEIGKLMGGYIIDYLGLKDGKGPFNIELFAGSLDDNNTPLYFEGAMILLQPYLNNGQLVVRSGQTRLEQVATQNWEGQLAQARMDNLISGYYSTGQKVDAVLSPYDGLSIGILSALKAIGYGRSADLPFPVITGQDCEIPSVKSIIAGEQKMSTFVDTRVLSDVAVKLTLEVLEKGYANVNMPNAIDNGSKMVSAQSADAQYIDIHNYRSVLIDSGYYTEADLF